MKRIPPSESFQGGLPTPAIYHRGHRYFARSPALHLDLASGEVGFSTRGHDLKARFAAQISEGKEFQKGLERE